MVTRYEVWLNKKSLSAIDPAIYILDIAYGAPKFAMAANDIPGRNGQRITDRYAQSTSVVVTFEIRETDVARRQEVAGRVQAWAMQGGALTTNDRRGQRLNVICEDPPSIGSALKWTQALKMTFTAYEQPFWEDEHPRTVTLEGTDAQKSLYVPGFGAYARAEATVRNMSGGVISALTVQTGESTFEFEGLGLTNGATLEIGYKENGMLYIRCGEETKMQCRTARSDDDLMIQTGKAETVGVRATGAVSATFKARGLYL